MLLLTCGLVLPPPPSLGLSFRPMHCIAMRPLNQLYISYVTVNPKNLVVQHHICQNKNMRFGVVDLAGKLWFLSRPMTKTTFILSVFSQSYLGILSQQFPLSHLILKSHPNSQSFSSFQAFKFK